MRSRPILKNLQILFFLSAVIFNSNSQTVSDYDGNIYQTVTIGNQTWITENLRTTHYSNGEALNLGTYNENTDYNDTTKNYFYYNDDQNFSAEYGCLYSWYAAVNGTCGSTENPGGIQGICPEGWHIPSLREWEELENYLGDSAATKLLAGGNSGFEAKLAGIGGGDTPFQQMNESAFFLSSDPGEFYDVDIYCYITIILLRPDSTNIVYGDHSKTCGYSIRCVKDSDEISYTPADKDGLKIHLYPNPCNDHFYIRSDEPGTRKAGIYSGEGRLLRSIDLPEGNTISVSDLDKGLYFVIVFTENTICTDILMID